MINYTLSAADRWRRPIVGAFFGLLLLVGLLLVRDYGLSVDENQSRHNGMLSLKHVCDLFWPEFVQRDQNAFAYYQQFDLRDYYDRDYGVAFEMPVSFFERLLRLESQRAIFWFRHLCTFLVCMGGVGAVYQLTKRRFKNWRLGLLGALLLVLSPRLFAESFYNDKDAVFMALFAVATNTAIRFIERPTLKRAFWHALACAITIDVRIMGVLLPMATLAMLALRIIRDEYRALGTGRLALGSSTYLLLLPTLVVALWPYLWDAPIDNFLDAFRKMAQFRWGGQVLYMGHMVTATELPWHYALVWICITTPVLYVLAFVTGGIRIVWDLVRRGLTLYASEEEWQDLFFLGLTVTPLLAVVALHSVLYDGWRQLYFVYPTFLLVAMRGLVALLQWQPQGSFWGAYWSTFIRGVLIVTLVTTAAQIAWFHPQQQVYFNFLPGRHIEQKFEMDYWSLSYRWGLEWITSHDSRPVIYVNAPMEGSVEINRWMLDEFAAERVKFVADPEKANYFMTTYRWHPDPYPYQEEVARLEAGRRRVLSIFRIR
ncbi:glycosyltransferase family 39 protein [Hymenobacter crusticola]|uniref:Glycosyltransferase RgtA/B/C/D-like domain-containing protein n=1 Tax=Hymenobacter crusticola TaxID=1770526 RepID=A0A243WDB2_9BACT|nr:glycosyltransferase family 39 protein [Hymenobacter crusticola]OUJ73425.1 hypothetical protein BXP70_13505 [Hymenobacter crusticola]